MLSNAQGTKAAFGYDARQKYVRGKIMALLGLGFLCGIIFMMVLFHHKR
jgi:hypothetical protein